MRYLATLLALFIFFHLGVMESVIHKLSLSRFEISYAMGMAILLSLINVQLWRLRVPPRDRNGPSAQPDEQMDDEPTDACSDRESDRQVSIGINLGGCVVPIFFAFYLLHQGHINPYAATALVMLVAAVVYPLSRVEGRRGLVINLFGAAVSAALGAVLLGGEDYLAWAYGAAVLGTLIGGDLLHLAQLRRLQSAWRQGVFIGGAGLMDAIFLSGLFAMMMAEVIHEQHLYEPLVWSAMQAPLIAGIDPAIGLPIAEQVTLSHVPSL